MKIVAVALIGVITLHVTLAAQAQPDVWRALAQKLDAGTEVTLTLREGQRVRAVFLEARDKALLIQPKTRITVPVQEVPYDAIAALEPRQAGGMGAGKAAAIGIASGAATFFGIMLVLFATIDD